MTLLKDAQEAKKYDSRLLEKSFQTGRIQNKEYEDFVKSLEDDSENLSAVTWEDIQKQESK